MNKSDIYLVRHGIVKNHPNEDEFDERGISFAENLNKILNLGQIDFIAYVGGKNRCKKTVENLALMNGLVPTPFSSDEFKSFIPYYEALKYDCAVICYSYSEIKKLLSFLKIKFNHRNDLYEFIYKINSEGNLIEIIKTEYKK